MSHACVHVCLCVRVKVRANQSVSTLECFLYCSKETCLQVASLFHSYSLFASDIGTSAAAKSGATYPSATAITSELFVSHTNHEQNASLFSLFLSFSLTASYTGTFLLTLRGRPLRRILSLPQRPREQRVNAGATSM